MTIAEDFLSNDSNEGGFFQALFGEDDSMVLPTSSPSAPLWSPSSDSSLYSPTFSASLYSTSNENSPSGSPSYTAPSEFECDMSSELAIDPLDALMDLQPQEESLDSIIRDVVNSNINMAYSPSLSEPCLKKRKHSEIKPESEEEAPEQLSLDTVLARVAENPNKVFLSREELLHLTSKEFDKYKKALADKHSLTAGDRDQLQKQRRVIKNREYSQNSRQKKRQRTEELEAQIALLQQENRQLREENSGLKQKIWRIVAAYQRMQFTGANSAKNAPTSPKPLQKQDGSSSFSLDAIFSIQAPMPSPSRNTGACLFVILLSIGLLFSLTGNMRADPFAETSSSRTGRIILGASDNWVVDLPFWMSAAVQKFSKQVAAQLLSEQSVDQSSESSLTFVTTLTTSLNTQISHSTSRGQAQNGSPSSSWSWDDTHVCDFDVYTPPHTSGNITAPAA